MSFIDLHIHTTASDGTFTPKEIIEEALRRRLSVIAITDHDTTAGIKEALNYAQDKDILVIPGIEISCEYNSREIHMLGLFISPEDSQLENRLSGMREEREERNLQMIALMRKDGILVTKEKLLFENPNTVITRAHFARYLLENGYVKTKEEAFKKFIGDGCKYYLPKNNLKPETAIQWIHEAGGIAFLAHPYLYTLKEKNVKQMISELTLKGLDGIEAYHSTTDQGSTNRLREYAKEFNLLVSGGSDFHGENKPYIYMGVGKGNLRITDHVYEKIINKKL